MIAGMIALLLSPPLDAAASSQVLAVEHVDLGQPLAGADYLLIAEAARHPSMRRTHLSCYRIYVHDQQGARWVSFVGARDRVVERETQDGTEITYLPPDPNCRSISFEMNAEGRVARVIRSRH